ncbi:MAG: adenylate/guanylate cyclase domain-containing protein [Zoogloeaceae bacterium]|jgi:class 3 adenylate cyclase|nr:adenylate/guanylate cyclase domain-containing protein [Zoogloeaceae bacterium]
MFLAAAPTPPSEHQRLIRPGREAFAIWFALTLAISASLGLLCHLSTRYVDELINHELAQLALIAARFVDGDAQWRLQQDADTGSAEYLRQIEPLLRLHLGAKQLRYIYTIRLEGDEIHFLLDTANWLRTLRPQAQLFHSNVMERYQSPDHAHFETLRAKKVSVSGIFSDEYGTFKSACAPIFDHTGKLASAACVDMDVLDYQLRIDGIREIAVLGFLLLFGSATLIAWFMFHRRVRLARQLADLWQDQEKRQTQLEAQNLANETLLARVLPCDILCRLRAGDKQFVEMHAQATVMFVNIDCLSGSPVRLPRHEQFEFLSQVFTRFGQLASAQGLTKIRTQGNHCLIASGLDSSEGGHARQMAKLALDLAETFTRMKKQYDLTDVSARFGIATGPVIAGLIDTAPLAYDLWGETVNTASRLEIFSEPGKIQCDESFVLAVGPGFAFFDRGEIHIRDKGFMHTYFLLGETDSP